MASTTYTQYYADGTSKVFKRKKQGRNSLPTHLVKVPVTGLILPSRKAIVVETARRLGMSVSEYIEFALTFFDYMQFTSEVDCSTQ